MLSTATSQGRFFNGGSGNQFLSKFFSPSYHRKKHPHQLICYRYHGLSVTSILLPFPSIISLKYLTPNNRPVRHLIKDIPQIRKSFDSCKQVFFPWRAPFCFLFKNDGFSLISLSFRDRVSRGEAQEDREESFEKGIEVLELL